jgi:hypothetical protein
VDHAAVPRHRRHLPRRLHDRLGKTGWTFFVIVLPFLGVFVCLVARGHDMGKHEQEHARAQQQAVDTYIREAAGTTGPADELARLSDLKNRGEITDAEFQHAKGKVLAA